MSGSLSPILENTEKKRHLPTISEQKEQKSVKITPEKRLSLKDRESYCYTLLVKRGSKTYPTVYSGKMKGKKIKKLVNEERKCSCSLL